MSSVPFNISINTSSCFANNKKKTWNKCVPGGLWPIYRVEVMCINANPLLGSMKGCAALLFPGRICHNQLAEPFWEPMNMLSFTFLIKAISDIQAFQCEVISWLGFRLQTTKSMQHMNVAFPTNATSNMSATLTSSSALNEAVTYIYVIGQWDDISTQWSLGFGSVSTRLVISLIHLGFLLWLVALS